MQWQANMHTNIVPGFQATNEAGPTTSISGISIATRSAWLATYSNCSTSSSIHEEEQSQCHLLGRFALLIQTALGALALLSLLFKRWLERPQRPVHVWIFDSSKQVFGSAILHISNIIISISRDESESNKARLKRTNQTLTMDVVYTPNPCSIYILNLFIDVSAL